MCYTQFSLLRCLGVSWYIRWLNLIHPKLLDLGCFSHESLLTLGTRRGGQASWCIQSIRLEPVRRQVMWNCFQYLFALTHRSPWVGQHRWMSKLPWPLRATSCHHHSLLGCLVLVVLYHLDVAYSSWTGLTSQLLHYFIPYYWFLLKFESVLV